MRTWASFTFSSRLEPAEPAAATEAEQAPGAGNGSVSASQAEARGRGKRGNRSAGQPGAGGGQAAPRGVVLRHRVSLLERRRYYAALAAKVRGGIGV